MSQPVLQILHPGLGASLQDAGRVGWRRYGVPMSGVMDGHAATWANRLVGNPPNTPVIELLLQGARLAVLRETWLAITGADSSPMLPMWRPLRLSSGEVVTFPRNVTGTWTCLAVAGGIAATPVLGSASAYPRGRLGNTLIAGDLVLRAGPGSFSLPPGVVGQSTPALELRDYAHPPHLRVWPAPQWTQFRQADRERFFQQPWTLSSQSDRVGYRLEGTPLESRLPQLISEPVRLGTIQIPENGRPIVTMRDGPTVGGYAKLGVIEPTDLAWLAQCRPGQQLRFQPMES